MSIPRTYLRQADQFLARDCIERPCVFALPNEIEVLPFRSTPYWYHLSTGRHLGIHRPDDTMCNWTARILSKDKLYKQKCVGPALELGRGEVSFRTALARAFEWFDSGEIKGLANEAKTLGRTKEVCFCPIGDTYTVGHALRDYCEWTRIARSPGGHYNNLVLINHHIVPGFANIPLEDFNATNLRDLAVQVLETPPKFGFMERRARVTLETLSPEDVRRRKRTFNSLVSILRMAFRHAWDNGEINSERPWRCLKRISVQHVPRTIFLDRSECQRLLDHCTPALRDLVLAALYSGCRAGELGNLRVQDVGREGYGIRIAAFKRSPARFVFLPDEGMAFFLARCEGKTSNEPVLLSDMGKVWRKQHTQLFRRAVARAGLPKELVFHGLRHTYASDLVKAGVPLMSIAKQLGHANIMTVMNTYGHLAEQVREAQIRSLFSPLDPVQIAERDKRQAQLDALWSTLPREDWRNYTKIEGSTSTPAKSFARPSLEVLKVFQEAELTAQRRIAP